VDGGGFINDYSEYILSGKEKAYTVFIWSIISGIFGYMFYQSMIAIILIMFFIPLFSKQIKKQYAIKRKKELRNQFKEVMLSVSSALRAGYSIENAFVAAIDDIQMLFGNDSLMCIELKLVEKGMKNNRTLEHMLASLSKRSGVEELVEFTEVFQIAKRNGGDINHIIQRCSQVICEKAEVNKEIEVAIHAKQFEQKIMNVVPILVMFYIRISSPGFFDPLYYNLTGIIVMTACLCLYGFALFLGNKITSFEV